MINFFKNLSVYLNSNIKFSIIGASYNDENYLPYGSFDSKLNNYLKLTTMIIILKKLIGL